MVTKKVIPQEMGEGFSIIIEPMGNGYMVRPLNNEGKPITPNQVLVFNDLGVAEPSGLSRESSLTCFIQKHFTKADEV